MKYWLTRILVTLSTIALVVLGFFFLTIALVIGGAIALVFGVRLWWTLRRLKREGVYPLQEAASNRAPGSSTQENEPALDGEYQVVERESRETTATRLPDKEPKKYQ